jgi:predicted ABC-type ATPase
LLLFAGPNGSGKSTITTPDTLARFGIPAERYINADNIARQMAMDAPAVPQEERERTAFRLARDLRRAYRESGVSFAFETVFSHPSTLLDMSKCRSAGFEIVVLFVTTDDPAINGARVAGRFQSGGHDVPVDRIYNRYDRVMALLPRIVEDADRAFVYDNSRDTPAVYPFARGIPLSPTHMLPKFLHTHLLEPLERRAAERQSIMDKLGITSVPEEEAGVYVGPLWWRSEHYLVHEVMVGLVCHDRLLVPAEADVGTSVTVTYQEGVGVLSPL